MANQNEAEFVEGLGGAWAVPCRCRSTSISVCGVPHCVRYSERVCVPSALSWIRLEDSAVCASRMKVCLHVSDYSTARGDGDGFRTSCYLKCSGICVLSVTLLLL